MLQNYTVFQSIVINYIKGAQCKSEMCIGSLCLYSYSNSRKQGFSITLLPCHEIIVRVCDFGKWICQLWKILSSITVKNKFLVKILRIIQPCYLYNQTLKIPLIKECDERYGIYGYSFPFFLRIWPWRERLWSPSSLIKLLYTTESTPISENLNFLELEIHRLYNYI